MRTIKTGLAIFLVLLVAQVLDINSPLFAGVATLITMQGSVSASWKAGKNRMLGTMLGAIIGLIFSIIAPNNPLVIGLGVVIIIHLCNALNWKKAISISSIVFMAIMLNQSKGNRLSYSIYRTLDTFLGIIVGMVVNYFISPPNIEKNIQSLSNKILQKSDEFVQGLIWGGQRIKLEQIKEQIASLEKNYYTLEEELAFKIYTDEECDSFRSLLLELERLYIHLELMSKLEETSLINKENQYLLAKRYKKKAPSSKIVESPGKDSVFNYHLRNALTLLTILEESLP